MNISTKSKKLFVGFNWKMNPNTLPEAKTLFHVYNNLNLNVNLNFLPVVFLPGIYINPIQEINSSKINVGSQDISDKQSGAFTGQISGQMLSGADVKYTLINHSETNRDQKLDFETISNKFIQALQNEITPILCISFDKQETAKLDLTKQLQNIFTSGLIKLIQSKNTVFYIALEPVLNIGSGKALECSEIDDYLGVIQNCMSKLELNKTENYMTLYGGSVNAANILEIGNCDLVDGFLLGGASIDPDQINQIFNLLK
jgi:triosephosphate isomerase (TIM)